MSEFNRHEPGFDVVHRVAEGLYTFSTEFLFQGQHPTHNRSVIVHVPAPAPSELGTLAIINPVERRPVVVAQIRRLEVELSATVRDVFYYHGVNELSEARANEAGFSSD